MMHIRRLDISDYDAVYALWTSTAGMGLRSLDDSRDGIARFLRRNPTTNFVACEGKEIIGTILCGHDGRRAYIYHAAVLPDRCGQGIGTDLLDAVIAALGDEGIRKAALVVFENNVSGARFWEKTGFLKRDDVNYRDRTLVVQP